MKIDTIEEFIDKVSRYNILLLYGLPYTFKTKLSFLIASKLNKTIFYIANGKHRKYKKIGYKTYKTDSFIEEIFILFNLERVLKEKENIIIWDTFLGNYSFIESYLDNISSLKLLFLSLTQLKHLSLKYNTRIILIEVEDREGLPPLWKYIQEYIELVIHTKKKENENIEIILKTPSMKTMYVFTLANRGIL